MEITPEEIIKQIKEVDKLDEFRINQLKTIYEHRWYEESLKDPVHIELMKTYTLLKLSAERWWGKDWYKIPRKREESKE